MNLDGGDWGRTARGGVSCDGIGKFFDLAVAQSTTMERRGWHLHHRQPILLFAGADPIGFVIVSIFNTVQAHKDNWAAFLGEETFAVNMCLYIRPDWRRKGMARRLLERAHDTAVANGATHSLLLVAERNADARTFYSRLGFREVGVFMKGEVKMLALDYQLDTHTHTHTHARPWLAEFGR